MITELRFIRPRATALFVLGLIASATIALAVPSIAGATTVPTIFHGCVKDAATGLPIPGVAVSAEYYDVGVDWYPAGSALTGVDGTYTLINTEARPGGIYNVRFIAPAPYGYPVRWEFAEWDGISPTELNLTLGEAPVIAAGTVRDGATGDPMPYAKLTAWANLAAGDDPPSWSTVASITCSSEGTYTVRDTYTQGAGQYRFRFSTPTAPEYESYLTQDYTETWNGTSPISLDVTMSPSKPLATGTIRTHPGLGVLPDAHIHAYANEGGGWVWTGSAQSGYDGLYTVKDLLGFAAGNYKLVYAAPDGDEYGALESKTILRSWDGNGPLSIDTTLAAVIATGTVTVSAGGLPISGATVKLEHLDGYWATLDTTVTGPAGTFTFTDNAGKGAGGYRITAEKTGHGRESITRSWSATQTMQIDIELQALAADSFEPDDSTDQARSIVPSGPSQAHTIFPAEDVDFATFRASAGVTYTITTFDQHGPMDTVMTLFVDGAQVDYNDDGYGTFSAIIWRASQDGTACVRVAAYSGTTAPKPGFYGLSIAASAAPASIPPTLPSNPPTSPVAPPVTPDLPVTPVTPPVSVPVTTTTPVPTSTALVPTKLYRSPTGSTYSLTRKSGAAYWTYHGTLVTSGGRAVSGKAVRLQRSGNGQTWTTVATLKTSATGRVSRRITFKSRGTTYWRWDSAASSKYSAARTPRTKITVR